MKELCLDEIVHQTLYQLGGKATEREICKLISNTFQDELKDFGILENECKEFVHTTLIGFYNKNYISIQRRVNNEHVWIFRKLWDDEKSLKESMFDNKNASNKSKQNSITNKRKDGRGTSHKE